MLKKDKLQISAQISWVYTRDLDATTDFYARILELECSRDEGSARIFKPGDSAFIGVCEVFANRVVEPEGGMISIVTDDVDAWYRRLIDNGPEIDQPPQRSRIQTATSSSFSSLTKSGRLAIPAPLSCKKIRCRIRPPVRAQ
jgi:predicted enzyme related to lactoylglutathione lyase